MSGIPPQLDVQPGTPTGEWAVKTTSALSTEPAETANAATMNPTTAQLFEEKNMRPGTTAEASLPSALSAVSTPGHEFPGAFPDKQEAKPVGSEIANTVTDTATRVAQTVTETAQVYVPVAAEKIGQYLPKSMADMMSGYIPGMSNPQGTVIASENDIPHNTSMPSTELTGAGARERVGGVGALPGSLAESSVTKLPDERAGTVMPATVGGVAAAATETAKGVAETVRDTAADAKDRVTHGGHTTAITASTVPSRELDGAKPGDHSSGVGALPGSINEPAVALLPDEGGRGITNATSAAVGTNAKLFGAATLPSNDDSSRGGVSGGVGALPGYKDEQGVAMLPDERPASETGNVLTQTIGSTSVPSREAEGARPGDYSSGIGALPGRKDEQGVAVLPDEKSTGKTGDNLSKPTDPKIGETTHLAESARKEGASSTESQSQPPKTSEPKPEKQTEEKKFSGGLENKGDMYDTDYHPAELHPLEGKYEDQSGERDKEREPAGEKEQEQPLTGAKHADSKVASHAEETSPAPDDDKSKKVGFMAKMKGEAKILLGKIEGKKGHDKVEEGQRIKAGETTPTAAQ